MFDITLQGLREKKDSSPGYTCFVRRCRALEVNGYQVLTLEESFVRTVDIIAE
jgi:hypothetical protein